MNMSRIRKAIVLFSATTIIAISFGYLSSSDTLIAQSQHTVEPSAAISKTKRNTQGNAQKTDIQPQQDAVQANHSDTVLPAEHDTSSELINDVMSNFQNMDDILENIDHPSVQAMIAAMPKASQKTIAMAALKQSVSKRLDLIEANPVSPIDLISLNQDIDTLAKNLVMMPGEARNLKAYLQQHTKI